MAPTPTDGTITVTSTETDIFTPVTGDKYYTLELFLDAMTATETFVIRIYKYDNIAAAYKVMETITLTGSQSPDVVGYIPTLLGRRNKVTIQKTAGTDRAVNFTRWEQT